MAFCVKCGEYFHRDASEKWKKLCLGCWIAQQNGKDKIEELEDQIRELQQENFRLRYCSPPPAQVNSQFEQQMGNHIKFLIFACHPDRNGGSAEAGEVTKWLLDFREQSKTRKLGGGDEDSEAAW